MKKILSLKYLLGALCAVVTFTACDKFKEDVPPARMSTLILNDDFYNTYKNQNVQLDVLANDTIGGTATLQFGQPQHGTIQTINGAVFYQPGTNYIGPDSFSYQACLGSDCASAVVNIVVKDPANCTIKAFDDILNLPYNTFSAYNVILNDDLCGIDTSATSIIITQAPQHGYAEIANGMKIRYSPQINYIGSDELTYTISNSKGSSTAKVKFNLAYDPQNCRAIAKPDSAVINRVMGTMDSVSVRVALNDYICPNGNPVTVRLMSPALLTGSQVFLSGTGISARIIYLTSAAKNQDDIVHYAISQGNNQWVSYLKIKLR